MSPTQRWLTRAAMLGCPMRFHAFHRNTEVCAVLKFTKKAVVHGQKRNWKFMTLGGGLDDLVRLVEVKLRDIVDEWRPFGTEDMMNVFQMA